MGPLILVGCGSNRPHTHHDHLAGHCPRLTLWAALAPTYSNYMVARYFQGLGVSPAVTVGLTIINDIFPAQETGTKLSLWDVAIDTGLSFGPSIGEFSSLAGHLWV